MKLSFETIIPEDQLLDSVAGRPKTKAEHQDVRKAMEVYLSLETILAPIDDLIEVLKIRFQRPVPEESYELSLELTLRPLLRRNGVKQTHGRYSLLDQVEFIAASFMADVRSDLDEILVEADDFIDAAEAMFDRLQLQ